MFVRERMTTNPITVGPDTSLPDALRLMRDRKVRRLPVVDGHGKLMGIVSDKDLLQASPSPATSLAVWEIPELLSKLKVARLMTREVITVTEDTPLEEAARIMVDRRIGGLPVMHGQALVGIITETDLFKTLLELLGGRRPGIRVAVTTSWAPGTLARLTTAIAGVGGDLVGLGLSETGDPADPRAEIVVKVQGAERATLIEAIRPIVYEIRDVRET